MKWVLPLYLLVFVFTQNALAQNIVIKEDENPHFSLWRCEHLDIARKAFTSVFNADLADGKFTKVYLTSYFIKHDASGSGITTLRLVNKENQTQFFSISGHKLIIEEKHELALEAKITSSFESCFEKSLSDWKKFKPAKGFATYDDIANWLTFPGANYKFADKISKLCMIERLADRVPIDYISDHNIMVMKSGHWGEHNQQTSHSNKPHGVYEVDMRLMIAPKVIEQGVKMLPVSAKAHKEDSAYPEIDATVNASIKACEALLKQFAITQSRKKSHK